MQVLFRRMNLSEEPHGHFERPLSQFGLPRGGRPGCSAGPTRAQSGRSVEVERPSVRVYGVSLKSVLVTLSHPYRSLASQGGEDQGCSAGSVRARSGRSVEVERPFCDVDEALLRASMVTLSGPYRRLASLGGDDQGDCAGPFETKVVVLLR